MCAAVCIAQDNDRTKMYYGPVIITGCNDPEDPGNVQHMFCATGLMLYICIHIKTSKHG